MRSTDERMELLKKRTDALRKKRRNKREKLTIACSYAACIVFIAAISLFTAYNMQFENTVQAPLTNTASIFTDGYFLGYTVVGILAFLLGICVTVLCSMIHKRNKEEADHDGTD